MIRLLELAVLRTELFLELVKSILHLLLKRFEILLLLQKRVLVLLDLVVVGFLPVLRSRANLRV